MNEKIIVVGKINGFYGVKGFVKVFSYGRPRESILNYDELMIYRNDEWKPLVVKAAKSVTKHLVMQFEGYNSKDDVTPLLGTKLAVYRENMPSLEKDEYYWIDLLGLTVINQNGNSLGEVKDILETGANDVLIIRAAHEDDILIPYVFGKTIAAVNLEEKQIIVDWEEGD